MLSFQFWLAYLRLLVAKNPLASRLVSGTALMAVGAILAQALSAMSSIATARILSVDGFGQLGFVRSTLIMFGVIAGSGLGLVATRQVARMRDGDPTQAGSAVVLLQSLAIGCGVIGALLVWFSAELIAVQYVGQPSLAMALRLGCLLLGLNAYNGVQLGAIAGCEAFGWVALLAAADGILSILLIPAGALVGGVYGAVGASVLVAALGSLLKHQALVKVFDRHGIVLKWRGCFEMSGEIRQTVLPAMLLGIAVQPFEWVSRVWLTRGAGFGEMGVFTAGYTWGQFVAFVPAQVSHPAMPMLANLYSKKRTSPFVRVLTMSGLAAAGSGALVALIGMAASGRIVASYGPGFATAGPVLNALFLAYALASVSTFLRSVLVATGRLWSQALHAVVWGITLITWFYWSESYTALALAHAYAAAFGVAVASQSVSALLALKQIRHSYAQEVIVT